MGEKVKNRNFAEEDDLYLQATASRSSVYKHKVEIGIGIRTRV